MASKPRFDPRIHLINDGDEFDKPPPPRRRSKNVGHSGDGTRTRTRTPPANSRGDGNVSNNEEKVQPRKRSNSVSSPTLPPRRSTSSPVPERESGSRSVPPKSIGTTPRSPKSPKTRKSPKASRSPPRARPSVEETDAAIARFLHEQMIEEARNAEHQKERDDMELARRMQEQEEAHARNHVEYVRSNSNDMDNVEDMELALTMQNLERLGMGRLNSERRRRDSLEGARLRTDQQLRDLRAIAESPPRRRRSSGDYANFLHDDQFISFLHEIDNPSGNPGPRANADSHTVDTDDSSRRSRGSTGSRGARTVMSAPTAPSRSPHDMLDPPYGVPSSDGTVHSDAPKKKKRGGLFKGILGKGEKEKQDQNLNIPPAIPPPPAPNQRPGPLPYSVAISRSVPTAPNVQTQVGGGPKKKGVIPSRRIATSAAPICCVCNQPATSFLATLDKKFHPTCFRCVGCHKVIDPNSSFAYMTDEHGGKNPLHRSCYSELYGVKCAVCMESIPAGADGKISYVKHPFFDKEQMCPRHASNPGRRCSGCHRFEPNGEGFADLGDSNRCVCYSCCRSVVVDSEDAKPLWDMVIRFMEHKLGLPIWPDMRTVPILVVGFDALNDQLQNSPHGGSSQIMTRGLCLSEHQSGRRFQVPRMRFDKNNRSFCPRDAEAKGYTYYQVPDADKINPDSTVTAILCLSGLPADLTASVLAHEATHAWIKLHPNFDVETQIPLVVEEGCCQLMAMLLLNEGLKPASQVAPDKNGPSDAKLRQYFKFSIETDDNDIYGTGYRLAAKAYSNIGIEALLGHVVLYQEFPET